MKNCTSSLLSITKWTLKFSCFLVLLVVSAHSGLQAGPSRSQSLQEVTIDLTLKDKSLKDALGVINKKTGFRFVYNEDLIAPYRVNINASKKRVDEVLDEMLSPTKLAYREQKGTVVIIEKETKMTGLLRTELPSAESKMADKEISGIITDSENGDALPGVSVLIKGTTTGTITDMEGKYSLKVSDKGTQVLVFSYVGYVAQEITVGSQTALNIKLAASTRQLSELMVVGYGTMSKEEFTGSAARVSGEKLKDMPVQSFDQGLAGRATGVSIGQPNGVLNNAPVIRIRGINSISLSSYPLIVVDGIPINTGDVSANSTVANNPLGDINPADIESIDVLKDAASTSIYGSRAAAGVLLITTKSGKTGKAKVTYEGWAGATRATRLPTMLDAEQFMTIKNEAVMNAKILGGNANNDAVASALFFPTYNEDGSIVNTNWYDKVYQTGFSQNHSVSISGGSESTKYYFSSNYSNQSGILKTNEFTRKAARFNVDHKLNSWLSFSSNINYNTSLNSSPNTGSLSGNAFGLVGSARLAWLSAPNVYAVNPDGSYNLSNSNTMGMGNNNVASNFYNPIPLLDLNKYTSENDRIIANFGATVKIVKGLQYKFNYAMDRLKVENVAFNSPVHGPGFSTNGSATNSSRLINNLNWTSTLNYQTSFATKHNVSLLAGYDIQKFNTSGWGATRTQLSDPFFNEIQGSYGQIAPTANVLTQSALVSFFSRFTYDFDKRYFFTLNYRRDGNSALGSGKKYGNFGGVSGGWTLSEEEFYKSSALADIMSSVKLRASWGRVGNSGVSAFGSLALYESSLYAAVPTWNFSQGGNPDLGWETSNQTNIGADLSFLNDRIQLEATYYANSVNGLILNVPQSPSKGIPGDAILMNIGSMYNRGLELGINASIIRRGKFSWNTSINYTKNKNKVTELYGAGTELVGTTSTAAEATNITRVGYSVGSLYGAKTDGVNPENGQRVFINGAGDRVQYSHVVPSGGSRWTYLDGTAAPAIGVNDYYLLGNALPTYYGGFINTIKYGNFDLGVNFTYSGGNLVMNGTKGTWRDQRFWNNTTEVLERWTTPGQVTNIPRVVYGDLLSNGSSWPISENAEKGDFLRLQSVSLGYKVPTPALSKIGISSVRLYTQVFNAFILTKYTGTDPEISVNGNSNTTPGVDKNSIPQGRTITFGLNLGF
ncbi:SusC/RagA family TonB-linked outer membrane protein [Dyadobacter luteus]|jgi:TonB-linked SusC/RagA family outer membrane protein|uniref:SusC/RagA family TonB-linked outer membrane protein n=1 Tax=Dyadobacter luteus TaxID=2259619 RepID=A0A3D8YDQ2_9BACT|nr:SusC/RagA family TonB-linked outer membrane protein [Dyadobacter luteus]REA62643.1 SusC/RagA family TonB-linked outer membrane protein [Dyadobacter luteus]